MSNHLFTLIPRTGLAQIAVVDLAPVLARAIEAPFAWMERARDRRELAGLDDATLKDIGVTRADAEHEVAKHFWQA